MTLLQPLFKVHTSGQWLNISKLCSIPAVPAAATQSHCQEDALASMSMPRDSLAPTSLRLASPTQQGRAAARGKGKGTEQAGLDLGGQGAQGAPKAPCSFTSCPARWQGSARPVALPGDGTV